MKKTIEYSLVFLFVLMLSACNTKQKALEKEYAAYPTWIKQVPMHSDYYYAVGAYHKRGGIAFAQKKAREEALSGIAEQIGSQIKSETTFYSVEDNKGLREYLQSQIKTNADHYLKGYELVEQHDAASSYFVLYRLSKMVYEEEKALRKNGALSKGKAIYNEAEKYREHSDYLEAMKKYAASIDAVSDYLNESTEVEIDGTPIELAEKASIQLNDLLNNMNITGAEKRENASKWAAFSVHILGVPVEGIPISFTINSGYLEEDQKKTNVKGEAKVAVKVGQTCCGSINGVKLSRLLSKNVFIRKQIKSQVVKKKCIQIK